jgi:hypothetical protein
MNPILETFCARFIPRPLRLSILFTSILTIYFANKKENTILAIINPSTMKKKLFFVFVCLAFAAAVFVACKKESNDGESVGYSQDKGSGDNPNTTH